MHTTMQVIMRNPYVKRLVLMTATVWGIIASAVVTLIAQGDMPPLRANELDKWVNPQNIVTAVVLVYGAGVLRQQFAEAQRQIAELRVALTQAQTDAAEAYVRKDVAETRFRELQGRVDALDRRRVSH